MNSQPPANPESPNLRGRLPGGSAGEPASATGLPSAAPFSSPARQARVLVAEDDPFVRAGIVGLLDERTGLVCCAEVGSLAATAKAVAQHRPDLVVMDLQLADGEALGLIHSLRLQFPALPILVLSHHDETLYAEKALQAGARGYLMKEAAAEHLLSAIHTVRDGRTYLSQAMAARLFAACNTSLPFGLPKLH